jgi:hypothetical protein
MSLVAHLWEILLTALHQRHRMSLLLTEHRFPITAYLPHQVLMSVSGTHRLFPYANGSSERCSTFRVILSRFATARPLGSLLASKRSGCRPIMWRVIQSLPLRMQVLELNQRSCNPSMALTSVHGRLALHCYAPHTMLRFLISCCELSWKRDFHGDKR